MHLLCGGRAGRLSCGSWLASTSWCPRTEQANEGRVVCKPRPEGGTSGPAESRAQRILETKCAVKMCARALMKQKAAESWEAATSRTPFTGALLAS